MPDGPNRIVCNMEQCLINWRVQLLKSLYISMSIILLTVLVVVVSLQAQEKEVQGLIKGKVINGTDGSLIFADEEVELLIFSKTEKMDKRIVRTDNNGAFNFADISTDAGYVFMVGVNYEGVLYHSDRITFEGSKEIEKVVTVYESTHSDRKILIESEHVIIDREQSGLRIMEIISINNVGNRTYKGLEKEGSGEIETLVFDLPRGYSNFKLMQMIPPEQLRFKEDGFALTGPIIPGRSQFNFTFNLPGSVLTWKKDIKYPTGNINLLYSDPSLNIISDGLSSRGAMKMGDNEYIVLTAKNIKSGSSFSISFGGAAKQLGWISGNQGTIVIIFIIGLVALTGFSLAIKARAGRCGEEGAPPEEEFELQKNELIKDIALLDDRFEAGALAQKGYDEERSEKKAQLLEIVRIIEEKRVGAD